MSIGKASALREKSLCAKVEASWIAVSRLFATTCLDGRVRAAEKRILKLEARSVAFKKSCLKSDL